MDSADRLILTILGVLIVGVLLLLVTMSYGEAKGERRGYSEGYMSGYKAGQIAALTGKVDYILRAFPDSTRAWVEAPKTQNVEAWGK